MPHTRAAFTGGGTLLRGETYGNLNGPRRREGCRVIHTNKRLWLPCSLNIRFDAAVSWLRPTKSLLSKSIPASRYAAFFSSSFLPYSGILSLQSAGPTGRRSFVGIFLTYTQGECHLMSLLSKLHTPGFSSRLCAGPLSKIGHAAASTWVSFK